MTSSSGPSQQRPRHPPPSPTSMTSSGPARPSSFPPPVRQAGQGGHPPPPPVGQAPYPPSQPMYHHHQPPYPPAPSSGYQPYPRSQYSYPPSDYSYPSSLVSSHPPGPLSPPPLSPSYHHPHPPPLMASPPPLIPSKEPDDPDLARALALSSDTFALESSSRSFPSADERTALERSRQETELEQVRRLEQREREEQELAEALRRSVSPAEQEHKGKTSAGGQDDEELQIAMAISMSMNASPRAYPAPGPSRLPAGSSAMATTSSRGSGWEQWPSTSSATVRPPSPSSTLATAGDPLIPGGLSRTERYDDDDDPGPTPTAATTTDAFRRFSRVQDGLGAVGGTRRSARAEMAAVMERRRRADDHRPTTEPPAVGQHVRTEFISPNVTGSTALPSYEDDPPEYDGPPRPTSPPLGPPQPVPDSTPPPVAASGPATPDEAGPPPAAVASSVVHSGPVPHGRPLPPLPRPTMSEVGHPSRLSMVSVLPAGRPPSSPSPSDGPSGTSAAPSVSAPSSPSPRAAVDGTETEEAGWNRDPFADEHGVAAVEDHRSLFKRRFDQRSSSSTSDAHPSSAPPVSVTSAPSTSLSVATDALSHVSGSSDTYIPSPPGATPSTATTVRPPPSPRRKPVDLWERSHPHAQPREYQPGEVIEDLDEFDDEDQDVREALQRARRDSVSSIASSTVPVPLESQEGRTSDTPAAPARPTRQPPPIPVIDTTVAGASSTTTTILEGVQTNAQMVLSPENMAPPMSALSSVTSLDDRPEGFRLNPPANPAILSNISFDHPLSKPGRSPTAALSQHGSFPDVVVLSRFEDGDARKEAPDRALFAVEAPTWHRLLTYFMWHGLSRIEAAPLDVAESTKPLEMALTIRFSRPTFEDQTRVRLFLELVTPVARPSRRTESNEGDDSSGASMRRKYLHLDSGAALAPAASSFSAFNQTVVIPKPYIELPIDLGALASTLHAIHKVARLSCTNGGLSFRSPRPSPNGALLERFAKAVQANADANGEGKVITAALEEESTIRRGRQWLKRKGKGLVGQAGGRSSAKVDGDGIPLPAEAVFVTPFDSSAYG